MKIPFASYGAILSVLGFFAWMSFGARSETRTMLLQGPPPLQDVAPSDDAPVFQERTGGSAVPCAVPLAWHIARLDESFGLSQEEATAAVRQATTLWDEAVGRRLFSHESGGELPVRFVYDERQERAQVRSRARANLEAQRDRLDERSQRYNAMHTQYQEAFRDLDRRVANLNDSIRYWNARGGAPVVVQSALGTLGRALEGERDVLTARGQEIEGLQQQLVDDSDRFNRDLEANRRGGEALEAARPVSNLQSGAYREAAHTQDGRVTSVTREIRIYRFDSLEDLVRVAAHELGHALGLGHSGAPRGLMREEFTMATEGAPSVEPADVDALRALCPGL